MSILTVCRSAIAPNFLWIRQSHNIEMCIRDSYNTLDRSSVTGPLRPIQFNILTKWHKEYRNQKDLIIKLHTGAGKTLVGLLIALSYINNGEGPVVYVCPNIYLMQQVCRDAQKFGVPFCTINKDNEIPNDFLNGKRVLITYVQKVFNGLYSKKTVEKFKVFIGFKNLVCCNLCVSTDGFKSEQIGRAHV